MGKAGMDKAQTEIKIAGRNINNLRYADDTTLMTESEEELKSLMMKVKEKTEKLAQTHVHRVGDAIHPSHPLSSPSPPAFNPSQHQGLFQ